MTNSITEAVAVDAAIDAVVLAWTHESKEDMVDAVDALLRAGRYDEATVEAVASQLDTVKGLAACSFAADLAGSVLLSPTDNQTTDEFNIEVFAIPLIGTGDELARFGRNTGRKHAWAEAMKRHGLVAGTSRVCILPGVWSAYDLVAMTPQMIRDVAIAVGTSMVAGQDMILGPVAELAPLAAGIDGGSVIAAGVALAVVLDENPDTDVIDPLRALFGNDAKSEVVSPIPEAVADPELAWTAA